MMMIEWTITMGEGVLLASLNREKRLNPSRPWTEGAIMTMTDSSQTEGCYIMTVTNTGNVSHYITGEIDLICLHTLKWLEKRSYLLKSESSFMRDSYVHPAYKIVHEICNFILLYFYYL